MSRVIDFVDTSTRDGNQSLWGATGLTTGLRVALVALRAVARRRAGIIPSSTGALAAIYLR